jgi:hypothetical protein
LHTSLRVTAPKRETKFGDGGNDVSNTIGKRDEDLVDAHPQLHSAIEQAMRKLGLQVADSTMSGSELTLALTRQNRLIDAYPGVRHAVAQALEGVGLEMVPTSGEFDTLSDVDSSYFVHFWVKPMGKSAGKASKR